MNRRLRIILPVLAVVGAAGATSLVLTRPWDGPEVVERADASPREMGICNVSVTDIPDGVMAAPITWPVPVGHANNKPTPNGPAGDWIYLLIWMPLNPGDPGFEGLSAPNKSRVALDARTGDVIFEHYRTPGDEVILGGILDGAVRLGPWSPSGAAWPRTDTPPTGEIIDTADPALDRPGIAYRRPDPASGLIAGHITGGTKDRIQAYTCDSIVEVDLETGRVTRNDVTPQEQAMFQRFLSGIRGP